VKRRASLGKSTPNTEKFSSITYDVWEYADENGKPQGSLTVDPHTQKVQSKSISIYADEPEYDLNALVEKCFKQDKFLKYIPCRSRGLEEVLVNEGKGVFIAARDGKATLVSWSDPKLTKLRIERFYEMCAKLQPPRKSGR
jgi:hypothetical protein